MVYNLEKINDFKFKLPKGGDRKIDAFIYSSENLLIEDEAVEQLSQAAAVPGVVAALATPDIHTGFGVPIGCVLASLTHVVPAAVGYDINCGMRLINTPFYAKEFPLHAVVNGLRRIVPLGEGKKNLNVSIETLDEVLKFGVFGLSAVYEEVGDRFLGWDPGELENDMKKIEDFGKLSGDPSCVSVHAKERGRQQLGTLGGGNHFLEIQIVDTIFDSEKASFFGLEKDKITIMIHTGSRGLGHQVASDYMKIAKESKGKKTARLAAFDGENPRGKRYINAMNAAANYAYANRHILTCFVRREVRAFTLKDAPLDLIYDVAHNIMKKEIHNNQELFVHRKGATRAFPKERMKGTPFNEIGQPVIIPGSMGTASYLLLPGPNVEETLCSVNHGAGRVMSRTAASGRNRRGKKKGQAAISDSRFRESMKGILLICEDKRTIKEEAPDAYKDIDEVVRVVQGAGLAVPIARMRPLAVLKG